VAAAKKRKMADENRNWTEEYFFVSVKDIADYLVCNRKSRFFKEYNIKGHYKTNYIL
jgi:hypothetical protein